MVDTESNDDELFSMDELEKDLKRPRGGRRIVWFVAGLVLGVAGTILLPRYAAPYLPFGGGGELLTGPVLSEERDGDRLLLTIEAEQGAFIAGFSRRVSEIALLVEPGDTVTISAEDYDPFIEDPDFEGVRKAHGTREAGVPASGAEVPGPGAVSRDSAVRRDSATAPDSTAAPAARAAPDSAAVDTIGRGAGDGATADTTGSVRSSRRSGRGVG